MGAADFLFVTFERHGIGVEGADDVDLAPSTGYDCIKEIALEQDGVLLEQSDDDDWVLAALTLADRDGVGVLNLEELALGILNRFSEFDSQAGSVVCDGCNDARVAVADVLVVIFARLDDSVSDAVVADFTVFYFDLDGLIVIQGVEMRPGLGFRVEHFLERCIQIPNTVPAFVHGRHDLEVFDRVDTVGFWDVFFD